MLSIVKNLNNSEHDYTYVNIVYIRTKYIKYMFRIVKVLNKY